MQYRLLIEMFIATITQIEGGRNMVPQKEVLSVTSIGIFNILCELEMSKALVIILLIGIRTREQ